jgi:peptide-methionine (R)-S-oxide reductase
MSKKLAKTDAEWKQQLTVQEYAVCRCSATEPPFTGKFWDHKATGTYCCVCCGQPLFESGTKYDSGTGWPSFWEPVSAESVGEKADHSHGMVRVEVVCSACDAHLGHVFPDGPAPTGMRYCINSAALAFADADADG